MPKRKPKIQPIEPLHYTWGYAGIFLQVTPEDFVEIVLEKNLTVIRKKETRKDFYHYYIFEPGIVYYTRSKAELTEIRVDFLIPGLNVRFLKYKD
jgi:hypothetical protein